MPSLLDIAPSAATVQVRGVSVSIPGVSAKGIAFLMGRFPELGKLMKGEEVSFGPEDIMRVAPEAVSAIIAAGTGHAGDVKAEAIAADLGASEQLDLMERILAVTMPQGAGPFMERFLSVVEKLDAGTIKAPVLKSESESSS